MDQQDDRPGMTEYKTHILSTRPLEAALLEQAAGKGIGIDTLPFITTEPLIDTALRLRIQDLSRSSLFAVFTSMNAVEAVTECLKNISANAGAETGKPERSEPLNDGTPSFEDKHEGVLTERPPDWHIFCIGSATSRLVREYFGEEHITGTAASAKDLADTIIDWLTSATGQHSASGQHSGTGPNIGTGPQPATGQQAEPAKGIAAPREVFFFCGDQRRDELPQRLRQQDIKVNELVVYKTTETPHKMEHPYDGIVFFSPSAVHSFFRVNNISDGVSLFAIGETTADTIRTYTSNQTIISQSTDKSTLILQVIDYYTRPEPGGEQYINNP